MFSFSLFPLFSSFLVLSFSLHVILVFFGENVDNYDFKTDSANLSFCFLINEIIVKKIGRCNFFYLYLIYFLFKGVDVVVVVKYRIVTILSCILLSLCLLIFMTLVITKKNIHK